MKNINPNSIKNDRFLKALARQPVDRAPMWVMRQAGRYLPEYRKVRAQCQDFMALCQTPELACEVTLQPLRRFPLDAAIVFSDILTVPHAMGLDLAFLAGEGPCFHQPVRTLSDIQGLKNPDPESELGYVMETIRLLKSELNDEIPLIGFSGSPWTVATYMVEGKPTKAFTQIKKLCYQSPEILHTLLERLTRSTITYLQAQVAAGADVVMIFDTWGGVLEKKRYLEFSLSYMKSITEQLSVPVILFTKNGGKYLSEMVATGCQGLGLDWTADLSEARASFGDKVAFQGNLDPSVLYGSPDAIAQAVREVFQQAGTQPGFIFNLGHGIHPDIPVEHMQALVESVHALSPAFGEYQSATLQGVEQ